MPKNPIDYLHDYHKDKVERNRKVIEYTHTQTDSFITWIIGFSFTGLLLIAANFEKFKQRQPTAAIIVCLFVAILVGIAFRFVSYRMTLLHKALDDYYYGRFQEVLMTPITNEHDLESLNYDQLLNVIKEDFNTDLRTELWKSAEDRKNEEPSLREYYLRMIQFSKEQFALGIKFIADVEEDVYKIKKEETLAQYEKASKKNKIGFDIRRWTKWKGMLYLISGGSFLIAVSILCVALLIWLF